MNCWFLEFSIQYFWTKVDCWSLKPWKMKQIKGDYYINLLPPQTFWFFLNSWHIPPKILLQGKHSLLMQSLLIFHDFNSNHSQYHSLDRYLKQNTALYDGGYYISANVIKHCIICDAILHDQCIGSYSKNLSVKSNFCKGNTSDQG